MKTLSMSVAVLAVILAAPALTANTVYTWTDENGVVHFSQSAPQDKSVPATETSLRSASMTGGTFAQPSTKDMSATEQTASNEPVEPSGEQAKATPTKNAQACTQARNMLATLDTGRRLRIQDPDTGELIYAGDEDLAEQRRRANAAIERNC